jgi:tRNA G18 (ribose-2'-O)-methylase SpoU
VTDPDDPALADYRDLRRPGGGAAADAAAGVVVVEGRLAVERVLEAGPPLRSLVLTPARAATLGDLVERAGPAVDVVVVERDLLRSVTGFDVHRGVLAAARRPPAAAPAEVVSSHRRVAVLCGLSDGENVGAAFRTAAALGLAAVLVDQSCADPLARRSVRVSQGWSAVLPHARLPAEAPLAPLHEAGLRTVALTPAPDAIDVDAAAASRVLDDPVALVVGAEGPGLAPSVLEAATARVRIPMAAGVDSLNVATALGVAAAFAAARRGWR